MRIDQRPKSGEREGEIDYRAVVLAAPDLYLLMSPALVILEASDAYLRATMTKREDILGRDLFEVFPDNPADRIATGVANVRASLAMVLESKSPQAMPIQRYPVRRPVEAGGGFEERFWRVLNTPIFAPSGAVRSILLRAEDITELVGLRRQSIEGERRLREMSLLSEHYGMLLDSAPDAMLVIDGTSRIQFVNAQAQVLFGYEHEEMLGQPLEILLPERFRTAHRGRVADYFANPVARPMASGFRLTGRRKDGSEVPIEVSLSPHRGERGLTVSAAIRDVTERRSLEATARLTAERLRSAVESIQDAIALFDADDRLILCNSAYAQLIQPCFPDGAVGLFYVDILDPWLDQLVFGDQVAREDFRRDCLARRRSNPMSSFDVRTRDGRSLRVTDRRTAEGGLVTTIWDLTDDERRATELHEARRTAESASAAKSEFLASMSHELRTPLNAILGFAQLLARDKREPLSLRHRERVGEILSGGEHLLHLINDILDLSRIESGNVAMSLEPVDVEGVVQEVRATLAPIATRQQISLDVSAIPPHVPPVKADRTRLVQVLLNLGSNAIKYNRPNGSVRFEIAVSAPRVRATVIDTGVGIPREKQEKLFQPFQRAGQETGPIEGTGIGLVITRRLTELMGGVVGFHSVPDAGSSFWIEIPIADITELSRREGRASTKAPAMTRDRPRHLVVYVEDNPANVDFMQDLMETLGNIELVTVPTAEIGVQLARARRPGAVIMDINLPGMTGLEALKLMKMDADTADIPVIALTAAAAERDRRRGMDAGFDAYLTKPINVDELVSRLETLLTPA